MLACLDSVVDTDVVRLMTCVAVDAADVVRLMRCVAIDAADVIRLMRCVAVDVTKLNADGRSSSWTGSLRSRLGCLVMSAA